MRINIDLPKLPLKSSLVKISIIAVSYSVYLSKRWVPFEHSSQNRGTRSKILNRKHGLRRKNIVNRFRGRCWVSNKGNMFVTPFIKTLPQSWSILIKFVPKVKEVSVAIAPQSLVLKMLARINVIWIVRASFWYCLFMSGDKIRYLKRSFLFK